MNKLLIVVSLIIISGCASQQTERESQAVGMANPASVYCEQVGGKLEIVNSGQGQIGYCTLPSGEKVEEWALYRQNNH